MLLLITFKLGQTGPVSTSNRPESISLYTEYVQCLLSSNSPCGNQTHTHVLPTCVPVSHMPDSNVPLHQRVYCARPQKVNPLLLTLCGKLPTYTSTSVVRHWLLVSLQIIITYPHGCLHSWAVSYVFPYLSFLSLGPELNYTYSRQSRKSY